MPDFSKLPLWVTQRVIEAQLRDCSDADKVRARQELSGLLCRQVGAADIAFFGVMNVSRSRCVVFIVHRERGEARQYALEIWRTDREEKDDAKAEVRA